MPETPLPLRFDQDGLVPAVITDAGTGDVLMVGFMNEASLERTRATGYVHFWSRSRGKLWKKGESSGHLQRVQEIRVNCDLNSLLIEVHQAGAVCHDGYGTCFYRQLDADNSLRIVRDRRFDPLDVYPPDRQPAGLATQTHQWWLAYEWLRDNNLTDESGTSRRLRAANDQCTPRVADELTELAGVLDGSHRHGTHEDDLRLEAGQVLYWVACTGIWHGYRWSQVRPDRALDVTATLDIPNTSLASLLRTRAGEVRDLAIWPEGALLHETIALVGTCLRANGIDPLDLINADIDELSAKPYMPDLDTLNS